MQVPARIHRYPWSCGAIKEDESVDLQQGTKPFAFSGSPVISVTSETRLELPSRHEQFMPLGPSFSIDGIACRLYETPHGVSTGNGLASGGPANLTIHYQNNRHTVSINVKEALQRFKGRDEQGKSIDSELATDVLSWAGFFEDIIETNQKEGAAPSIRAIRAGYIRRAWPEVHQHLMAYEGQTPGTPRRALIVKIAQEMIRRLPGIVACTRRILLRERCLVPAGRMEEMDSACLFWLDRRPGETPVQKAGPAQKLLGVVRRETHDVHENRILKDFLFRCASEGRRYRKKIGEAFLGEEFPKMVQVFSSMCTNLAGAPHLAPVSCPVPGTPPNYVLLHDARYREIWRWYLRILRQDLDEDRFWDWQSRTWADIVRLLVNSAMVRLVQQQDEANKLKISFIHQGKMCLFNEQMLGCRIAAGSEPGPFLVKRVNDGHITAQGVLEIVHSDEAAQHPIARNLGVTGGHLYLVFRFLEPIRSPQVIVLWAVHTASAKTHTAWAEIGESASSAISVYQGKLYLSRMKETPKLGGIAVCSDMTVEKPHIADEQENAFVVAAPTKPQCWSKAVEYDLYLVIDDILTKMVP